MKINKEAVMYKYKKDITDSAKLSLVVALSDTGELDDEQVEILLSFVLDKYIGKKPKVIKNVEQWLKAATSKDENRENIMHVYYDAENDNTVATNGRSLHIAKGNIFEMPDDMPFMDIKGILKGKAEFVYPNYRQVIPVSTEKVTILKTEEMLVRDENRVKKVYDFTLSNEVEIRVDAKLWDEANSIFRGKHSIFATDELAPIMIKDDNHVAVIRPMRKK